FNQKNKEINKEIIDLLQQKTLDFDMKTFKNSKDEIKKSISDYMRAQILQSNLKQQINDLEKIIPPDFINDF
ncbi:MAG: hypothetical protein MHPSP_002456, partial [Paramarteilia canceri]